MTPQERNQEKQELIEFVNDLQELKKEYPKITEKLKEAVECLKLMLLLKSN